jgi:hypothetical protein
MPHQTVPTSLSYGQTVLWFLVGILISIVLPVAVKTLRKRAGLEGKESGPPPTLMQRVSQRVGAAWKQYGGNKYLLLLLVAVLVAVILVFLLGLQFYTPRDAALAGFGWESLINKLSVQQEESKASS